MVLMKFFLFIVIVWLTCHFVKSLEIIIPPSIDIHRGECITLNSNILNVIDNSSSLQTIYFIDDIVNSTFQKTTVNNGNSVIVTSFTQQEINSGVISYCHNRFTRYPSFQVHAFNVTTNVVSPSVEPFIRFSMFRENIPNVLQIGGPQPDFNVYNYPNNECYTFFITMFRNWLQQPAAYHYLSLQRDSDQCVSTDVISSFSVAESTNWFASYITQKTLSEILSDRSSFTIQESGPNLDVVANIYSNYMMPDPTTGACQLVKYRFKFILQIILECTTVTFGNIGGSNNGDFAASLTPSKIFVNDNNRLQLNLKVLLKINGDVNNWRVSSGPYPFSTTVANTCNSGIINVKCFQLELQSDVIQSAVNFWGNYILSFTNSISGTVNIPFQLQYIVPFPPIQQALSFTTSAQTFTDINFSQSQSQFTSLDTVFLKVNGAIPVDLTGYTLQPYNVYFCCVTDPFANYTDCSIRSNIFSNQEQFVTNGVLAPLSLYNVGLLNAKSSDAYGLTFSLLPIRSTTADGKDKRCFMTIQSYLKANSKSGVKKDLFNLLQQGNNNNNNTTLSDIKLSLTYRLININDNNGKITGTLNSNLGKRNEIEFYYFIVLLIVLMI
ncbi:hypothetical protein ABK040_004006 [Willaertia magna]